MISVKRLLGAYAIAASMGLSSVVYAQETEPVSAPQSAQAAEKEISPEISKLKAIYKEICEDPDVSGVVAFDYMRRIIYFAQQNPDNSKEVWRQLGIDPDEILARYNKAAATALDEVMAEAEERKTNGANPQAISNKDFFYFVREARYYVMQLADDHDTQKNFRSNVLARQGYSLEQYTSYLTYFSGEAVKEIYVESQKPENAGAEAVKLGEQIQEIFRQIDLNNPSELGGITRVQAWESYQLQATLAARENIKQARLPENAGEKALAFMDVAGKLLRGIGVTYDELPEKIGLTALELNQLRSDNEVAYSKHLYQDVHNTTHSAEEKFAILLKVREILNRNERTQGAKNPFPYDVYKEIGSGYTDFRRGLRVPAIEAIAEIIASFRANNIPFGSERAEEEYKKINTIFYNAGLDHSQEKTWEGKSDVKAAWETLKRDYHLHEARSFINEAGKAEVAHAHVYYILKDSVPESLKAAGFNLKAPQARAEAYQAISADFTEEVYSNLIKNVAIPAAQEKFLYALDSKDKKFQNLDLFEEIDQCLRDAGYNPEGGEGYELIGSTFEKYKELRRNAAVTNAKYWLKNITDDVARHKYIEENDVGFLLNALKAGGLDLEKEETYQEIGTTKAEFENFKKDSGYREPEQKPAGETSGIYRPKMVLAV